VAAALSDRRRWYALTASILGGALVGVLLWSNGPHPTLARDLVRHLALEPGVLSATDAPADPTQVQEVLRDSGVRLHANHLGRVTYAHSCPFRGHAVPHLVIQTALGPVTVLVLRDEKVRRPFEFQEEGYAGTIEPAGAGSIAVIGHSRAQARRAAPQVMAALDLLPLPPPAPSPALAGEGRGEGFRVD
jgi:hypothetical protein